MLSVHGKRKLSDVVLVIGVKQLRELQEGPMFGHITTLFRVDSCRGSKVWG